jgi:quinoprotein dehydrogenase-associated probable ABC transporter substrate-binding protein
MKKTLFCFNSLVATLSMCAIVNTCHAADKFRVCADPLNPPYSSKNLDGFENKIAALFAKQLGQELEYIWFPQRIGFIRNTLKAEIQGSDQFKCDVVMGVAAGDDLTLNTQPYYHSQYVMLIAKGRGWDNITLPEQLGSLPLASQEKLKIAMFDRGPGTDWLQQTNLLEQGVPYQSMSGDDKSNTAMTIEQDLREKKIDIAILWGPMAAYVLSQSPKDSFIVLPMVSRANMKFDFSMAMGVRNGDEKRKALLDKLIVENKVEIEAILKGYRVPLLPTPEVAPRKED